jgi:hypothetical protein
MPSTDLEHFPHTIRANQNALVKKHWPKGENSIFKNSTNDPTGESKQSLC